MALGTYTDVYSSDTYEKRVDDIKQGITELSNGGYVIEAKRRVENQINILKKKEEKIFNLFGVKTIQQLNQRLEEYKEAVINFSGRELDQMFINVISKQRQELNIAFNKAVRQVIDSEVLSESYRELGQIKAQQTIMQYLNDFTFENTGIKGRFSSSKGFKDSSFNPSKFTKEQKKIWVNILKNNSELQKYKNVERFLEIDSDINENGEGETQITWLDITGKNRMEWAQNQPKEVINSINEQITNMICNSANLHQDIVRKIINEKVLSENEYAFFVGENEKGITGIMGEIQGLYYLYCLLRDETDRTDLLWKGGTQSGANNSKPHIDLVLANLGIQVKNTTKDIDDVLKDIDFANASLQNILGRIKNGEEIQTVLENYYATLNFNIPYSVIRRKTGNTYYARMPGKKVQNTPNFKIFKNSYDELRNQSNAIDKLLSLSAAAFMYMDISENIEIDANILYLLGGEFFKTASSILEEVLANYENQNLSNFKMGSGFQKSGERTIVQALNSGKNSYSADVISKIKLTSSYSFYKN